MTLVEETRRFRLIIEFDDADQLENLMEFIGRSLDNGVLRAQFEWTAEDVLKYTKEDDDESGS